MAIPKTQIQNKVLLPDGSAPTSGYLVAKLSQPGSALDGATSQRVGAADRAILGVDGSLPSGWGLVPNDAIVPSGTYYSVDFHLKDGDGIPYVWTEKWQLASSPSPIDIGAVPRLGVVPGVAVGVALANGDMSGGSVTATGSSTPRALKDIAADVLTGEVTLPSPFPATGVRFFRGPTSGYTTSFNPDKYLSGWGITKTIYTNLATGNDSTGDGSSGNPYKLPKKAWSVALAAPDTAIQIVIQTNGADVFLRRDTVGSDMDFYADGAYAISGKRIAVVPDSPAYRVYVMTSQQNLSWSLTAGKTNTYQASRNSITGVADFSVKDAYGLPTYYSQQTSINNVEATAGSWYETGGLVYVHTLTGAIPNNAIQYVTVGLNGFKATLAASGELFVRNLFFVGGSNGQAFSVYDYSGTFTATKFVAWNCGFAKAGALYTSGQGWNGLFVDSIRAALIFNSVAGENTADGFNFHYTNIGPTPADVRNYYAVVVNSVSYNNGIGNAVAPNINNAFTSHEGANFAAIGCRGWNTQGPTFAFVNGCNTVLIGCSGTLGAGGAGAQHASYYFDNVSAPAGVTGAAYLDDCVGNDPVWDLSSDGSSLPITVRRFVGSKIPAATLPYVTFVP